MTGVRRALALSTFARYCSIASNFLMLFVISRLLTPSEIGVSVLGAAIIALACATREFVTPTYIIQLRSLGSHDVHTAFTLQFIVSSLIGIGFILGGGFIASTYPEPRLVTYIQVSGLAIFVECVQIHIGALLRRNMAFEKLALIAISNAVVLTAATIFLAWMGFSYMSFAWGWLISASFSAVLSLAIWRDLSVFRPSLRRWRGIMQFGGYNGIAEMLMRLYESVPYLVLGRVLPLEAVALYSRSLTVCQIPDKVFLSGVTPVLMPAFSVLKREGGDLGRVYIRAVENITALQWPALAVLCVLAYPIIRILLGDQWLATVPLVQVIAIAYIFSFSNLLNYSILAALGAGRDLFLSAIIIWPVSTAIVIVAAQFGLDVLALSWLFVVPFQAFVSICFVRRHIDVPWMSLLNALFGAFILALSSILGPILIVAFNSKGFELPADAAALSVALSAFGWVGGLWATRHPLLHEVLRFIRSARLRLSNEAGC